MTQPPSDPNGPLDDASIPEPRWPGAPDLRTMEIGEVSPPSHPRHALFAGIAKLRRHRSIKIPRRITVTLGILFILTLIAFFSTSIWLRHAMHAALPPLDGTLHARGLQTPVTITRDPQGVPSINAANLDDLLFSQGYITASDRLWQMDMLRRHASGTLAEILGSNLIPHDRLQRTLQLRATAGRAIAALPADQLHQLQSYAAGVNAFIDQSSQTSDPHRTQLPVEFHLLHYQPAPWTPRDSLLVSLAMFQDLSTGFPTKLRREAFTAHLPPELLADLYPVGSWRDHPPTQPPPDLTTPQPEIEQIPLDRSQSRLETKPQDILALSNQLHPCSDCLSGSNNWAVAGSHSASGAPLVSNDMHLNLAVPDIWYEAGLHTPATSTNPALDVVGFTLPGVPFVIVGRNRHVAWSFTILGADTQDVRIEHTRGSGPTLEYQRSDASWAPVTHHPEHIVVRGGHDIDLDVQTTTESFGLPTMSARAAGVPEIQTPIITPLLPSEHRTLSLAWTIYDPTNVTSPFLAINAATDGPSIVSAFANFGGPSINLIYADDHNHIGYHALGAMPIRGPAIQYPHAAPPPLPTGPPPPDGDDEDADPTAQARSSAPGHSTLLNAAYIPRPHRQPAPPPTDIPTPPAPTNFTIGSPISPTPVDALDASQIWSGYIPYTELPAIVDPPNGILATANSRITPDDFPYAITLDWAPPYRVERIHKQLAGRTNLTPAGMLALQTDIHSEFDLAVARRLSYALDHAPQSTLAHDPTRLHQAADILRAWDGNVSPNSTAPAIVHAAITALWPMLLQPQIDAHDTKSKSKKTTHPEALLNLYVWASQTVALEEILQHTPARWLPPGFTNWDDLLATAVERGLHQTNAPSNLSTWRYGPTHPLSIDHPIFSMFPFFDRLLNTTTGTGVRITGGDATTIQSIAAHFGPSERFTADLANPQLTTANITTGQSGNPASPNYLDQFLPWLNGTTFPLPLTPTQPTHTLTLLP